MHLLSLPIYNQLSLCVFFLVRDNYRYTIYYYYDHFVVHYYVVHVVGCVRGLDVHGSLVW